MLFDHASERERREKGGFTKSRNKIRIDYDDDDDDEEEEEEDGVGQQSNVPLGTLAEFQSRGSRDGKNNRTSIFREQ